MSTRTQLGSFLDQVSQGYPVSLHKFVDLTLMENYMVAIMPRRQLAGFRDTRCQDDVAIHFH